MNKKRIMSVVALLTAVSMTSATVFAAGPVEDFESTSVSARTADQGWHEDSNGWWYLDEYGEYPRDCIRYIHGDKYLFDKNGYMKTGWYYKDTNDYYEGWYHFDESSGKMSKYKCYINGKYYYFDYEKMLSCGLYNDQYYNASGELDTSQGWKCVKDKYSDDSKWYYVDEDGYIFKKGWKQIDNESYYFDPDTGELVISSIVDGYYVNAAGACKTNTGWKKIADPWNEHWVYVNENGKAVCDQWREIDGETYYFDENYIMRTGVVEGYYLNASGEYDYSPGWKCNGYYWYYVNANGKAECNGWKKIDGQYYYFEYMRGNMYKNAVVDGDFVNASGAWDTTPGWKRVKDEVINLKEPGIYSYVKEDGKAACFEWIEIDGQLYYFDYDGLMVSERVVDGYYLGKSGARDTQKGWKNYIFNGNKYDYVNWWFYVDESGKAVCEEWRQIDGDYYYFCDRGYILTDTILDKYYINNTGRMDSSPGWKKIRDTWCYVTENGMCACDCWKVINGKYYHFDTLGYLDTNHKVDGYYVDDDGIRRQ